MPAFDAFMSIVILVVYLIPSYIAFFRRHQSRYAIAAVNIIGLLIPLLFIPFWPSTLIGLLIAFIWSLTGVSEQRNVIYIHREED